MQSRNDVSENDSPTPNKEAVFSTEFILASFPVELKLLPADDSIFIDAKSAARQEFRDSSIWKRLRCRNASIIAERDRGTVYAVQIGSSVDFDWIWESAVAFRPHALPDDGDGSIDMADCEESPVDEGMLWSGEILDVDEGNGCLFIALSNPENPTILGSFLVRPFDFLGTIDVIYHESRFESMREELRRRLTQPPQPMVCVSPQNLSGWGTRPELAAAGGARKLPKKLACESNRA